MYKAYSHQISTAVINHQMICTVDTGADLANYFKSILTHESVG